MCHPQADRDSRGCAAVGHFPTLQVKALHSAYSATGLRVRLALCWQSAGISNDCSVGLWHTGFEICILYSSHQTALHFWNCLPKLVSVFLTPLLTFPPHMTLCQCLMTMLQHMKLPPALLPLRLYGLQAKYLMTSEGRAELQSPDQPFEVEDTRNQSPFRFYSVKQ